MARTVQEKYNYFQYIQYAETKDLSARELEKHSFAFGYCLGVDMYRRYGKNMSDRVYIQQTRVFNSNMLKTAKDSFNERYSLEKGYMCALRDCAKERKSKIKR